MSLTLRLSFQRPDGSVAVHWKGAAEIIVERCSKVMDDSGNVIDLNEDQVRGARECGERRWNGNHYEALEAISSMAAHSLIPPACSSSHFIPSPFPFTPHSHGQRAKALEAISSMAALSLRCIGLATAVMPPGDVPQETEGWKFPDTGLTLLAILGIKVSATSLMVKAAAVNLSPPLRTSSLPLRLATHTPLSISLRHG